VLAVGAAARSAGEGDGSEPIAVSTMWEVPSLAAWWQTLRIAEVVDTTASRVRPGAVAASWLAEDVPPLDLADAVAGVFVATCLAGDLPADGASLAEDAFRAAVDLLLDALDGWEGEEPTPDEDPREQWIATEARRLVAPIEEQGLLVRLPDAGLTVPAELAGSVARGVAMAMTMADARAGREPAEPVSSGGRGSRHDRRSDDPFDAPEVQAEMAAVGIVHQPGMAAQLLEELAPLLAEEGIDLDDLDGPDVGALNSALARATERHNLALSTPVGAQRERALTVLRLLSEALAEGSDAVASIVLNGIPSDPEEDRPSVAQVIGVGMGVLDNVHGASAFSAGVARSRIPEWNDAAQAAARDILDSARRGSAFADMDGLIRRHRGKAVLEGVALAVSATVAVRAAQEDAGLREIAERLVR